MVCVSPYPAGEILIGFFCLLSGCLSFHCSHVKLSIHHKLQLLVAALISCLISTFLFFSLLNKLFTFTSKCFICKSLIETFICAFMTNKLYGLFQLKIQQYEHLHYPLLEAVKGFHALIKKKRKSKTPTA